MKHYYPALDGLRAIAVLAVILFHGGLLASGWVGVQAFFVLSGFLITSILLRSKQQPFKDYLRTFYARRSLRIFPLYFLFVLVTLLLLRVLMPDKPTNALALLTYTYNFQPLVHKGWTALSCYVPLWSLSVEEQFYLIWPLLIFLTPRRHLRYVLLGIIMAGPLMRWGLGAWLQQQQYSDPGQTLYFFTLSQIDAFAWGALIPVFQLQQRIKQPARLWLYLTVAVVAVGLINLVSTELSTLEQAVATKQGEFLRFSSFGFYPDSIHNGQHVWGYSVLNPWFTALVLALTAGSQPLFLRWFNTAALGKLGKISYGVYIYHGAVQMAALHPASAFLVKTVGLSPTLGRMIALLSTTAVTILIAYLSYTYFEQRFLRLKAKYSAVADQPIESRRVLQTTEAS